MFLCRFISLKFGFSCLVCDPVMGDEGKLYVPQELVSVYRERVSNLVEVFFDLRPYHIISFSYIQFGYEFWNIWMFLTTT